MESFILFRDIWLTHLSISWKDGGRQEEERRVSQKNTIRHILSMGSLFSGKFPVI